jgi:hypothetical protein
MKLKLLLIVAVFAAGIGASYALADDGQGEHHGNNDSRCSEVHVHGTVAPQTLTVTLNGGSKRLNLAAGSQVVLQVGAAGQTVALNAEACSTTTGSTTQLLVKSAELEAKSPKHDGPPPTTTGGATTGGTTTYH